MAGTFINTGGGSNYDGGANAISMEGYTYKLRAAAPMPTDQTGRFVRHTFMAEKSKVTTYLYTEELPSSSAFRGQYGDLVSAQFNRLQNFGGNSFSGSTTENPEYIDEEFLGGI